MKKAQIDVFHKIIFNIVMNLKRKRKCADLIIVYTPYTVSSKQWMSKTPQRDISRIKSMPLKTNEKIKSQ